MKFGHFLLTNAFCARDWIDTLEIVETKVLLNKMVEVIVDHIKCQALYDYIIVGVDLVGTLLASRVAFTLQVPLTYIVPQKEETINAAQEIELNIEKNKKIILITDAIVTFSTLESAIEKYSLTYNIIGIYTIFYRESEYAVDKYIEKTFCINNSFGIELFLKSKCNYNKTKCLALNRHISEGENKDESN